MIILCEPQCEGFEHVEFNSALLEVVKKAFPSDTLLFLSEKKHLEFVQNKLKDLKDIEYQPITIPVRNYSDIKRQFTEFRICQKIFAIAEKNKVEKIIFCSVTSPGLFSIKVLSRKYKKIKILVTPHAVLEQILQRPSFVSWKSIFWIKIPLLIGNNNSIQYLLLGESIKNNLIQMLPNLKPYVSAIHHPYQFQDVSNSISVECDKIIKFGAFGVGNRQKGTDMIFKMVEELNTLNLERDFQFSLIGPILDKQLKGVHSERVFVPSPDKPISREDFDIYARGVDYAVFFYKPGTYRLTASGALLDAFSYAKPIIAIRNPFFEYYFDLMGDIGYLCKDYAEMKSIFVDILNNKINKNNYRLQQQNILKAREKFSTANIARTFQALL